MSGTVIAIGGFSPEHDDAALTRFVLDAAGRPRPRVCYVGLASGDFEIFEELFYEKYPAKLCEPTHLELLRDVPRDPREVLAAQDIVYLGGGSTPVLVAGLRILGLDEVVRHVWERGGVVCGHSAGAHAWFRGCITDSLGPDLRVFGDGLGIVDGTCVAHADQQRGAMLRSALGSGRLTSPAWAIEEDAAVAFSDGGTHAVSWRPGATANLYEAHSTDVRVTPLEVTPL